MLKFGARLVQNIVKPTDTHCATGETCGGAKYCPSKELDKTGRCAPEKK
jgi:hypothetical protein